MSFSGWVFLHRFAPNYGRIFQNVEESVLRTDCFSHSATLCGNTRVSCSHVKSVQEAWRWMFSFFWQVLFSLQQLLSPSSNCCHFSQRCLFLSDGFSPFESVPLFPHSCPGFWWPLCLFSARRSGHTAAFLCCLEPNIVLFVFSFISEDM